MDKSPTSPVGKTFRSLTVRIKRRLSMQTKSPMDKVKITEKFEIKDTEIPLKPCSGKCIYSLLLVRCNESIKRCLNMQTKSPMDKVKITEKFEIKDTEIPLKPCSAVQIKDYIKANELKQAYLNLLSLLLELQQERGALSDRASAVDLINKETDFNMLFETLRSKMTDIVRSSMNPSVNKVLLAQVATIILEEEKKPETVQGWREAWRNAVQDGVRDTLKNVPLDKPEQKTSWLAVHLGLLGKAVEDGLETVKEELLSSYPPDFNVFETYVSCHHEVVEEHLKDLLEKVTESKDYHALLDFIVNRCPSDLRKLQRTLKLDQDFFNKIKNAYYDRLMEDFKAALENIINIERDEVWKKKKTPDRTDDGFLTSHIHLDITQLIASYAGNLNEIDENLGKLVVRFSLEELHKFHIRFEEQFTQHTRSLLTSDLLDSCLWVEYHITYINTFNLLKEQMQCYKESCSAQVEKLERDVDGLTQRLNQTLMDHFKTDIKPYINGMMTKKWLKTDEDFTEVTFRVENYSGFCKSMRNPAAQIFVNDVHYYVMREYVSQLVKKKYSCKNTKNEEAAVKMRAQWKELMKLFEEMGSSLDWLYPLGNYLSDIIEMKNEKNMKNILHPLVSDYPDISKKQISAVLYFRNNGISLEKHQIINQFTLIKQGTGNIIHERNFFIDLE